MPEWEDDPVVAAGAGADGDEFEDGLFVGVVVDVAEGS